MRRHPTPSTTFRRLRRSGGHVFATVSALAALLLSFACVDEDQPDGGAAGADAPLVPADAEALEAYLKTAVEQHLPTTRSLPVFDTTTAPAPGAPAALESGSAFSTTTLQTVGVDEADLVKFDGETLFVVRQPEYRYPMPVPLGAEEPAAARASSVIISADQLEPEPYPEPEIVPAAIAVYSAQESPAEAVELATIPLPQASAINGMVLLPASDDGPPLLAVIGSDFVYDRPWLGTGFATDALFYYGEGRVRLWLFDVSDPAAPEPLHRSMLEGSLVAVRRIGDQLVLVTRSTPYVPYLPVEGDPGTETKPLEELDVQDLLPRRWVELPVEDTRPLVRPGDCFVPRTRTDVDLGVFYHPTLVTLSTIDLRQPDEPVSICAAGPVDRIYSSTRALYLAASSWTLEPSTFVHKFTYTERGPEFRGSGRAAGVPGGSDPDFGLGESGDAFGIMTMVTHPETRERSARLTLLGEATGAARRLEEISHLPNEREPDPIGKPGEQLYAVRFLGDRVYAVTFRRIDPLYVIDIGDPRNPFIAGELEIPGFSDSLHPITGDLLLGIGKDSIEDGGVDWFQGVKVELFDVSDPSAPASVDALVIGERGSETAARTDHHAFTALDLGDGTSRVALPISVADGDTGAGEAGDPRTWHAWSRTGLHLFEVDHVTPSLNAAGALIIAEAGNGDGIETTWRDRSRIQGEAVHYVHEGEVWSADWSAPEDPVGPQ